MPEQLMLFDDSDEPEVDTMCAVIDDIRAYEAVKHPARRILPVSDFRDCYEAHLMALPGTQRYETLRKVYIAQEVRDEDSD